MNKLLILSKNPKTFFIERLFQEASRASVQINLLNPWLPPNKSPLEGERVLVRSTAIHGSDHDLNYIDKYKLKSVPSLNTLRILRTKPLQFQYFKKMEISHLPWLDLLRVSTLEIKEFCADKEKLLIKPHRGQGGWGVRVFSNKEEFFSWFRESKDREYLLQPYVEEHQEVRVFFLKETFFALKRIKMGVAANFSQGGQAQLVPLSLELHQVVERIRRDLGLLYGAADFLLTDGPKGMPYLLEMNLVPGIEQLECVSGQNIAGDFLSVFMES